MLYSLELLFQLCKYLNGDNIFARILFLYCEYEQKFRKFAFEFKMSP